MRDIYSGVNDKWSKNHGRNLMSWKKLIRSIAVQKFYDVNLNKYGTWLRFLEDIWLYMDNLMVGLSGILDIG